MDLCKVAVNRVITCKKEKSKQRMGKKCLFYFFDQINQKYSDSITENFNRAFIYSLFYFFGCGLLANFLYKFELFITRCI